ncbi:MAG: secretin N-terminal domain-containing protein [Rariglobus sp.]|nr:secretin N-terminal domain-containing protein [Rariglobus sp.]
MRTRLLLLASLAAFSQVSAQEQPAVPAAPEAAATSAVSPTLTAPAATAPVAAASETSAAVVTKSKDTLSVDFPDEEIRTILRNVADLFELNLVIPDTLQGRTSLKLREVTWRQIFQVILSPIGYTFVEDGNIIKILSQAALAEEPLSTEIFIINYAKAGDIIKSIESIVDGSVGGKVIVDARSNALVITERPTRLGRIRPIIEKLDKATDQVMIETKFIEMNSNGLSDLGLDWRLVAASSGQVAKRDYSGDLPINPALPSSFSTGLFPAAVPTGQSTYATSVLSAAQLSAALNFIQSSGDSKVVSNPTVVTLNNSEAVINVGTEYPIPSYTYNAERGAFEVSGFEYKPIGVILKVTPQINSQGFVKLTVEPEISSSSTSVDFGGGGGSTAKIPIIDTKKTKTQVSLKDGHTLGIGGLISDSKVNEESRLPFFGSIPGIGRLFRTENKTTNRKNLLIFITAKIVSAESAKPEEIFDPRQIREHKLKRSDVSGYREEGDPFLPETPEKTKKDK